MTPATPRPQPKPLVEAVTDALKAVAVAKDPPDFIEVEVLAGGGVTGDTLEREIRVQAGAVPAEPARQSFTTLDVRGLKVALKGIDPVAARYVVSGITKTGATAVEAVAAAWEWRLARQEGQDGGAAP